MKTQSLRNRKDVRGSLIGPRSFVCDAMGRVTSTIYAENVSESFVASFRVLADGQARTQLASRPALRIFFGIPMSSSSPLWQV